LKNVHRYADPYVSGAAKRQSFKIIGYFSETAKYIIVKFYIFACHLLFILFILLRVKCSTRTYTIHTTDTSASHETSQG